LPVSRPFLAEGDFCEGQNGLGRSGIGLRFDVSDFMHEVRELAGESLRFQKPDYRHNGFLIAVVHQSPDTAIMTVEKRLSDAFPSTADLTPVDNKNLAPPIPGKSPSYAPVDAADGEINLA